LAKMQDLRSWKWLC